jgi:hypothetical protein
MPRNYDEMRDAEDRTFVMRDELFTIKRCRPEVIGEFTVMEKEYQENLKNLPDDDPVYPTIIAFAEKRLLLLIDDQNGAVSKWEALRDDPDNPITYGEIMDVSTWALELITGLPTMPPSPSAPGRGKAVASSKAE